ncbi:MAG: DUF885 domain-containing protein, partial [Clostridiales Family XIII bacterium]|nr:DUF885 domain-containing protein [Clostridiales Family XIII bacterium]
MFDKNRNAIAAILLSVVVLLSMATGCEGERGNEPDGVAVAPAADDVLFADFTAELFRHYAAFDSVSLNYLLAHPENYGIEKPEPTFGAYGAEAFKDELAYAKERFEELKAFDYDGLSYEQQLTYDILCEALSEGASSEEFLYHGDILSPTIGFQAELPILLSEYRISEKGDFDYYIALLETLPEFFENIATFEREKKSRGTFMAKRSAEDVIRQIDDFVKNPDENLLIKLFDKKVDAFEGLTNAEREDLKARNRAATLDLVIPAYKSLANSLAELNEDNARTGGLSDIEGGAAYYEALTKELTGSSKSVDELERMIDEAIDESFDTIDEIISSDPSVYARIENIDYPAEDPNEILDYLRGAISEYFPAANDGGYALKYVDESLEEFLSPAF